MAKSKCAIFLIPTILLLHLVILAPTQAAEPQPTREDWSNLSRLAVGQELQIVLRDVKSYRGKFQSADDQSVVFRLTSCEQTFTRESVLRVSTKGKPHHQRNALIGAGVGAGTGAGGFGVCKDSYREVIPCGGKGAAIGAAVFAPVGAGVGALIRTGRWHEVYRAE